MNKEGHWMDTAATVTMTPVESEIRRMGYKGSTDEGLVCTLVT